MILLPFFLIKKTVISKVFVLPKLLESIEKSISLILPANVEEEMHTAIKKKKNFISVFLF